MTTLEGFLGELDEAVRARSDPGATVKAVHPLLAGLIADPARLPVVPLDGESAAAHLLGRGDGWSVVLVVFPAHATTPVHDHLAWGLVGVVSGCEVETPYSFVDGALRPLAPIRHEPGAISHVVPPDREIHSIHNPLDQPSVSVHIYGADLAELPRHRFDVSTGEAHEYRAAYVGEPS